MRALYIIPVLFILFLFSACEKEEFIDPIADFYVESDTTVAFERIQFINSGSGQYFTYFTGDSGHVFEMRNQGHTGFSGDLNGNFNYSYSSSGSHEVTLLVTTYNPDTKEIKESTFKKRIYVKDNDEYFKLNRLEFNDLGLYSYDPLKSSIQLHVEAYTENYTDYSVVLYNYHRYFNAKTSSFYSGVDEVLTQPEHRIDYQTQISVDGVEILNKMYVDYTASDGNYYIPKKHSLTSGSGQVKELNVCPLQVPEFSLFKLAGNTYNNISTYNQNTRRTTHTKFKVVFSDIQKFTLEVDVPDGTDLTQLTPEFDFFLPQYTKAYVNDVEQVSGVSVQDFTNAVTYTLVYKQPGYEDVFMAESELTVTIK